jgi:hypothetical protein
MPTTAAAEDDEHNRDLEKPHHPVALRGVE